MVAASTFASGLTDPQGIALDQDGNVYVSEGSVGDLLRFTPDGTMSVLTSGLSNPSVLPLSVLPRD
jgi:sugar lactone lactonase YvrE